jgi:hypothetical protein
MANIQTQMKTEESRDRKAEAATRIHESAIVGHDSSEIPEPEGDPLLKTIKRWVSKRSYNEKLATVLLWQLVSKEGEFKEPDNTIGNTLLREWEDEVVRASGDPDYLEQAPAEEVAVTTAAATMIPWCVK